MNSGDRRTRKVCGAQVPRVGRSAQFVCCARPWRTKFHETNPLQKSQNHARAARVGRKSQIEDVLSAPI
jgi:hypothetical protein